MNFASLPYKAARRLHSDLSAKQFGRRGFHTLRHVHCTDTTLPDEKRIDLVTIAFNNAQTITHQIRLLNKYLEDPHSYTVIDNSSDTHCRNQLETICATAGVGYIALPPNAYSARSPSASHGLALNWAYRHYLKPRHARYFGFLDHDIYPVKPTSIFSNLQTSPMFGLIQDRPPRWYLWAGFCFFDRTLHDVEGISFMPFKDLDTGGANWKPVYSHRDKNDLAPLRQSYGKLRDGAVAQSDWYEMVGDWLHTFNASYWMQVEPKDDLVEQLLNQY